MRTFLVAGVPVVLPANPEPVAPLPPPASR